MRFVLIMLAMAVLVSSAISATIEVPADYSTIQAAIDAATNGDEVLVSPGTYVENIDFLGKAITVRSTNGRDVTFIESAIMGIDQAPGGVDSLYSSSYESSSEILAIVNFQNGETNSTVLDGFTIRNSHGLLGIWCSYSSPRIQNCDISYCTHDHDGAGIWCDNSAAVITNNRIHHNMGVITGAGVAGVGNVTPEIAFNEIYENEAPHGPGIGFIGPTSNVNIHHNLIRHNASEEGGQGALYINGSLSYIINNTIVSNVASGLTLLNGSGILILNNIITSNQGSGLIPAAALYDYNDIWDNLYGNLTGDHGISVDPMFMSPPLFDYHLQEGSPCIDAGHPDPQYNDPDGSRNDMGAFPGVGLPIFVCNLTVVAEDPTHVINHTPMIVWSICDPAQTMQSAFELEVGTDNDWSVAEMWATGEVVSPLSEVEYSGAPLLDGQTYFLRVRLNDGVEWSAWSVGHFRMNSWPTSPVPDFPVSQELVRYDNAYLRVVNATDGEDDALVYDFEVYADPALSNMVASRTGVEEQQDFTVSGLIVGLEVGRQYWWRAICSDGLEYSQWSVTESFFTRGQATINVPQDFATIQEAIMASGTGDTVLVAPGTYNEYIDFMGKTVVVISSDGPDVTFIVPGTDATQADFSSPVDSSEVIPLDLTDGGGAAVSFVNGETEVSTLDGFTINNPGGRGIYCYQSSPTIQNCDVSGCSSGADGAGIWCVSSPARIRYNRIHDNNAAKTGAGVGAIGSPGPVVSYNEIYNNQSPHGAGAGFVAPIAGVNVHHNLVTGNAGETFGQGAIYINGTDSWIINNTVVGNTNGVSIYDYSGTGVLILNNIIVWNFVAGLEPGNAVYDYNDVWGNQYSNIPGPNGISLDPLFVNPEAGNYELQISSPCVNAGHPDEQYNDPDGTRNDMGAFPTSFTLPLASNLNLDPDDMTHVVSHNPTIGWTFYDTLGAQAAFEIEVGTDNDWTVAEMWATGEVQSDDPFVVYAGEALVDGSSYYLRIRLNNGTNWGSWLHRSFRMNSLPSTPTLVSPIAQTLVLIDDIDLVVANSTDPEEDVLAYDFEIYSDPALNTLVASQYGVEEQPDFTMWNDVPGLEGDMEYWWRSRSFDPYESSAWAAAESFVTRGEGIMTILVPQVVPTIQEAIEVALDQDTIVVSPGTYQENIDFLGKAIVVRSTDGPEMTFIAPVGLDAVAPPAGGVDSTETGGTDASERVPAVAFVSGEGTASILEGFTIYNPAGRGVFCYASSPVIRNCDINGCVEPDDDGGGIWCVNSGAKIYYNRIHHNSCGKTGAGVGAIGPSAPEVSYNIIYGNYSPHGSGVGFVAPISNANIHHNLVYLNSGEVTGQGAIYINGSASQIINNTVTGNTNGITILNGTGIYIYNNIVVSSLQRGLVPSAATFDYNDVWNNTYANDPGPNGISEDPLFVDPENADYTLRGSSPCIDAGNPDPIYNDPDGSRNDMGAFWFCGGSLSGTVSVADVGLGGVAVDLYGSSGKILAATITDDDGYYGFYEITEGTYTVSITTPIGFATDEEAKTIEVTTCGNVVDFELTELEITPPQRTLGYWMHQVNALITGLGEAQETYDDMCTYLEKIRKHFNMSRINPIMVFTISHKPDCDLRMEELQEALAPKLNPTYNDEAKAQVTALLLNVVSQKISQRAEISEDGASVSQAITFCDSLIFDQEAENDSIAVVIPETINKGQVVPAGLIDLSTPEIMYKDGEDELLPASFALGQNYPNPFNPVTKIELALPKAVDVRLEIYNVLGQKVTTLVDGPMPAGYHTIIWDGSSAASGIYLYRVEAGAFVESRKMLLIK